jgi:hypothetical protein
MDWFLKLSTEVQIPIIGLFASVLTIVGVMVRARYTRNPVKESEYRPRPVELRLSESDHDLLEQHRDAIREHGEEIGKLREELIRGGGAVRRTRAAP